MHDSSECLEVKPGDCPVFHKDQGCPFKNVRNEEGKHLVEPVEAVGHDQVRSVISGIVFPAFVCIVVEYLCARFSPSELSYDRILLFLIWDPIWVDSDERA